MAVKPIPDGYHTVTPYLIINGAARRSSITARLRRHRAGAHARSAGHGSRMRSSGSATRSSCWRTSITRWAIAAPRTLGGTSVSIVLYVVDVDTVFERADQRRWQVAAPGCRPVLRRSHGHARGSVRPCVDRRHAHRRCVSRGDEAAHGRRARLSQILLSTVARSRGVADARDDEDHCVGGTRRYDNDAKPVDGIYRGGGPLGLPAQRVYGHPWSSTRSRSSCSSRACSRCIRCRCRGG